MTRSLLPHFLFLAFWLIGGSYLMHNKCINCNEPIGATKNEVKTSNPSTTLDLNASKITYAQNSFILSDAMGKFLDPYVTAFAERSKEEYLEIQGSYKEKEVNTSQFPDLGISRAIAAKNYLGSKGIDLSRVVISSQEVKSKDKKTDIKIEFVPASGQSNDYSNIREAMHLYFSGKDLVFSAAEREKLFQISRYLDQQKVGVLMVEGHTDSSQEWSKSMNIANEKALFVSSLLVENGLPEDRMSVIAYGPDKAIGDNKTKVGRSKNNRVSLVLKGKK